jgi:hypothetical protein
MALVPLSTQNFALILIFEVVKLKNVNFEAVCSDIEIMQNCMNTGQFV